MPTTQQWIAILTLVVPGIVGTVTALAPSLVPAFTRRGDREHELSMNREQRKAKWVEEHWTMRQNAYLDGMKAVGRMTVWFDAIQAGYSTSTHSDGVTTPPPTGDVQDVCARVASYGTDEVAEQFHVVVKEMWLLVNSLGEGTLVWGGPSADEQLAQLRELRRSLEKTIRDELASGPGWPSDDQPR